ncbi:hypothetical protein KVR01_013235 [Diaporthe batatas]|uniref:uncharacterized protein n=1 Tax=Diaporthe batatas TaxID=748121 RepID=UPI001D03E1A0|nr:uncharacterized protein KVR01_013235 [Diaporthe batatas]KAG8156822.1 hypothetical protein KVR01_013235 [Diaporthe batatas]
MSARGSQSGSRPSSSGGRVPSSDISSLEFVAGTLPDSLPEPYRSHVKDKSFKKTVKGWSDKIKKAKIKGQPHQSSTAPEQGVVTSIQLLNAAGKKVVDTVHVLYDGTLERAKAYYKNKK